MKKALSSILALILCLSLCACGNSAAENNGTNIETDTPATEESISAEESATVEETTMSKEDMLAVAVEIDDYQSEMIDNMARAEAKYVGNVYYITGNVGDITSDHLTVGDFTVYLSKEDLMNVSRGQRITVVGKIDSISYEEVPDGWGGYFLECTGIMTNAYFVTDITELTGTLTFYYMKLMDMDGVNHNRDGNPEAWVIGLDMSDNNVISIDYSLEESIPVEHTAGQSISAVQFGGQELTNNTKITVSGKVFYDNGEYIIRDAELVSVG